MFCEGVYERDGRKLVGVVLKCDRNNNNKRFEDLKSMMDYSYPLERKFLKLLEMKLELWTLSINYLGSLDLQRKFQQK